MLQPNVRSGPSVVNVQQQYVAHVHEAAAAHLAPIPESAIAGPATDQEVVVTSCSCRCPLLFRAREMITGFVSHQSSLNFCFCFLIFFFNGKTMTPLSMLS